MTVRTKRKAGVMQVLSFLLVLAFPMITSADAVFDADQEEAKAKAANPDCQVYQKKGLKPRECGKDKYKIDVMKRCNNAIYATQAVVIASGGPSNVNNWERLSCDGTGGVVYSGAYYSAPGWFWNFYIERQWHCNGKQTDVWAVRENRWYIGLSAKECPLQIVRDPSVDCITTDELVKHFEDECDSCPYGAGQ